MTYALHLFVNISEPNDEDYTMGFVGDDIDDVICMCKNYVEHLDAGTRVEFLDLTLQPEGE